MILYFSATGNTRFVAEQLAKMLGDKSLNLLGRIRRKDYEPIRYEAESSCIPDMSRCLRF